MSWQAQYDSNNIFEACVISELQLLYLVIDVPISLSIQANSDLQRFLAQRKSQGVEVGGGLDCVRPSRWGPETYTHISWTYNGQVTAGSGSTVCSCGAAGRCTAAWRGWRWRARRTPAGGSGWSPTAPPTRSARAQHPQYSRQLITTWAGGKNFQWCH